MTYGYIEMEAGRHLLFLQGHATGSETVCAGISSIVYALAGYLCNAEEHVQEIYRKDLEEGKVLLSCQGDDCVTAAYTMAAVGLAQIARQYPEYLAVELSDG